MPTKGVIFITKDYACYYAATPNVIRDVIPFRNITSVKKEATLGLIPNSVRITACDDQVKNREREVCTYL